MLSIEDDAAFERALKAELPTPLKDLLVERRRQVWADRLLSDHVRLLIVEPGDCAGDVELRLGFSILMNAIDQAPFGSPDFTPSFEWVADHGFCFEMVFVFNDSGFAHVVLIERAEGIDPQLLDLCRQHASGSFA